MASRKRTPAPVVGDDPGFAKLVDAFARDPELAAIAEDHRASRDAGGSGFGSRTLRIDGKIFAMMVNGRFVVKLPAERVAALIATGDGEPFGTGSGRVMKEWVAIRTDERSWIDLAREALTFVGAARAPRRRRPNQS